MKLITFTHRNQSSFGLAVETGVIDLGKRFAGTIASLEALIALQARGDDVLGQVAAQAAAPADYAFADVIIEKPLTTWGKCFCVGVNYPRPQRGIQRCQRGAEISKPLRALPRKLRRSAGGDFASEGE